LLLSYLLACLLVFVFLLFSQKRKDQNMSTPSETISLRHDHTLEQYEKYEKSVMRKASTLARKVSSYGLIYAVWGQVGFDADYINIRNGHTHPGNNPFPMPERPANDATAAEVELFKTDKENHQITQEAYLELEKFMLDNMGPDLALQFQDELGRTTATCLTMLEALNRQLGQVVGGTYKSLIQRLESPLVEASTHSITTAIAHAQTTHRHLIRIAQPLNEATKIDCFMTAVQQHQHMVRLYHKFLFENPADDDQTFNNLAAFFKLHVRNITTTELGYAAAATAKELPDKQLELFAASLQQVTLAAIQQLAGAKGGGGGEGGRGQGRGRQHDRGRGHRATRGGRGGRGDAQGAGQYCYFHGYNRGHIGTACRAMAEDPQQYAPNMIAARSHTEVAFGHV